jgi:hypothetical protein
MTPVVLIRNEFENEEWGRMLNFLDSTKTSYLAIPDRASWLRLAGYTVPVPSSHREKPET